MTPLHMNLGQPWVDPVALQKKYMKMGGESVGPTERIEGKGVGGIFNQKIFINGILKNKFLKEV